MKSGEYVLLYSVYDGSRLVDFDFKKVTFDESKTSVEETLELTVPSTTSVLGVKAMLWNGFTNIKAEKAAIELK